MSDRCSLCSSTSTDELSASGSNIYGSTDPKSSAASSDDDVHVDGLRDCSPVCSSTLLNDEFDDNESSESLSESLHVARSLQRAVF